MSILIFHAERIGQPGQNDPHPTFTIIQCQDEDFDKISIARRTQNLTEREAIHMVADSVEHRTSWVMEEHSNRSVILLID